MMITAILAAGTVPLCSLTFRIRGGLLEGSGLPIGGQMCRLSFAAAAGLAAATAAPWPVALATVPMWFIASTLPLFDSIGLGTDAGAQKSLTDPKGRSSRWWFWRDFGMLGVRGLLWGILPALALGMWALKFGVTGVAAWWLLPFVGMLMPVCYWLGRQSGCKLPGIGAKDYCQTAEAIYGAVLGLGVLAAVWL